MIETFPRPGDLARQFVMNGGAAACSLASLLIFRSTPFVCEPYPDDAYIFTVRPEVEKYVNDVILLGAKKLK